MHFKKSSISLLHQGLLKKNAWGIFCEESKLVSLFSFTHHAKFFSSVYLSDVVKGFLVELRGFCFFYFYISVSFYLFLKFISFIYVYSTSILHEVSWNVFKHTVQIYQRFLTILGIIEGTWSFLTVASN